MIETTGSLGLLHQALSQCAAILAAAIHCNGFERDGAADQPVMRFVDNAHCPASQLGLDVVTALSAGSGGRSRIRCRNLVRCLVRYFHDAIFPEICGTSLSLPQE